MKVNDLVWDIFESVETYVDWTSWEGRQFSRLVKFFWLIPVNFRLFFMVSFFTDWNTKRFRIFCRLSAGNFANIPTLYEEVWVIILLFRSLRTHQQLRENLKNNFNWSPRASFFQFTQNGLPFQILKQGSPLWYTPHF